MRHLLIRRLWSAVVLLFIGSTCSFMLVLAAKGNVAVVMAEARGANVTKADIEAIEEEYGLNDPIAVRYVRWLGGALQGDFGNSLRTGEDVLESFSKRLPVTATLILGAAVFTMIVGLGFGLLGALFPGSTLDAVLRIGALIGASTPKFFVGALLILLFGVILQALPTYGFRGPDSWILPCITVGLVPACIFSRVTRVSLEEAMTKPYVVTALSKGFARHRILVRDALPNVAPTLITTFGLKFALMIQAAIVVEIIFSWPGVSSYFVEAVRFRDLPVIQAGLMLFTLFFVLVNLTADMIVMALDPKQRRARV